MPTAPRCAITGSKAVAACSNAIWACTGSPAYPKQAQPERQEAVGVAVQVKAELLRKCRSARGEGRHHAGPWRGPARTAAAGAPRLLPSPYPRFACPRAGRRSPALFCKTSLTMRPHSEHDISRAEAELTRGETGTGVRERFFSEQKEAKNFIMLGYGRWRWTPATRHSTHGRAGRIIHHALNRRGKMTRR
jgi:hypothetical protein